MRRVSLEVFYAPIEENESRLFKTCNSLLKLGIVNKIFIVGFWIPGLDRDEKLQDNINIIRIPLWVKITTLKKGILRKTIAGLSFLHYSFGVVYYSLKIKPSYISCHNAHGLPACVFAKWLSGAKLIYVPHELEAERTALGNFGKRLTKTIENLFLRFCDKVVTVCEPISDYYIKQYNLKKDKVFTVRNAPLNPTFGITYPKYNLFREEFDIPENSIIYIYQGIIGDLRGLTTYLETFSKLDNRHHLVMMGFGDGVDKVLNYSQQFSNIHYKPAVPVDEIIKYSSSADVGLFIIPGELSLSYKFALPNKFYEYSIAGLFICVSENFEYLTQIVKTDRLGTVIGDKEESLYNWIDKSGFTRSDLEPVRESISSRKNSGWQNEEKIFLDIYKVL